MARLIAGESYDPNASLPSDREPFPKGDYPVELIETDVVPTKKGDGQLLKYTAQVVDGEHKDRRVWGQMNLINPNAQAQDIGQREFRALREVTGVPNPDDTEELHYKQFLAAIDVEPAKGEFKAKNSINWGRTVKLAGGGAAPTAANDNEPQQQAATAKPAANDNKPAGTAKRPWAKKAA